MGNYNIDDGELLVSYENYELCRQDDRIFIKVCKRVAGKMKDGFEYVAIPHIIWQESRGEYVGWGMTADEALCACLDKIKGIPNADILKRETSQTMEPD